MLGNQRLDRQLRRQAPRDIGADALSLRLRLGRPPVVARVADGRVLLDPRTLSDQDLPVVAAVLADLDLA
jgi:seryl-tRNA(Sec) selenium transferase